MKTGLHEYKEIKVWYNLEDETWECFLERTRMPEIQNDRLASIYKSIDNFLKDEDNFERFEAFVISGRYGEAFETRTVTTMQADGFYWTVDKEGRRMKENGQVLIKISPPNVAFVNQVKRIRAEADKMTERAIQILDKITIVPRG